MESTECFDTRIEDKIESTNEDIAKTDWYKYRQDKLIEIQHELSPKSQTILSRYNEMREEIFYKTVTAIYLKAFQDGVQSTMMAPILAPKR